MRLVKHLYLVVVEEEFRTGEIDSQHTRKGGTIQEGGGKEEKTRTVSVDPRHEGSARLLQLFGRGEEKFREGEGV